MENADMNAVNRNKRRVNTLTPFGIAVKKALVDKDTDLKAIGRRIGTSGSYISQIIYAHKNGKKYLAKIAKALDIDIREYPREHALYLSYIKENSIGSSAEFGAEAEENAENETDEAESEVPDGLAEAQ